MYKKTKPRSVMELLNKNLGEREVAAILGCSRNTVSEIKELCRQQGTPVKIVCDNLKTGVVSHPKKGEIILNDAYLALGEYYVTAIMPTGVKMPKQTVIAIPAIADTFTPDILEAACKKSLKQYHMPFYKTVYKAAENLNNQKELEKFKETNKTTGIVRGADYYG